MTTAARLIRAGTRSHTLSDSWYSSWEGGGHQEPHGLCHQVFRQYTQFTVAPLLLEARSPHLPSIPRTDEVVGQDTVSDP
jgi:hypothetical protein